MLTSGLYRPKTNMAKVRGTEGRVPALKPRGLSIREASISVPLSLVSKGRRQLLHDHEASRAFRSETSRALLALPALSSR